MLSSPPSRPSSCQVLAVSPSVATEALLAAVAGLPGPTAEDGGEPGVWKILTETSAVGAAQRVGQQRAVDTSFVLAVIDFSMGAEEQAEAIASALWEVDSQLPILILRDRDLSLCDWHLEAWRVRDRLAFLKTPCEIPELSQLMNLMGGRWLRDRQIEQLKQRAGGSREEPQDRALPVSPAPKADQSAILVVDDDETIRLVVSQVLATTNHQIVTAGNAEEAWQQWQQHRGAIKLVITDINMPGDTDGLALGQVVQAEDASVPVIYTSGYRAATQYNHLKDGVNYLSKPFGMADLLKVVERNLTGARGVAVL